VSDAPALRASDADRDRAVASLREHLAEGRLTLDEFTERIDLAYRARTHAELDDLARDLPAAAAPAPSHRKPTRFLFALFGSTECDGRIRVGRHVTCLAGFGNIDLDLRRATLEGDVVTVTMLGAFSAIHLYVPDGIEVDVHGFSIFGHKRRRGGDSEPRPGTPLVRVYAISLFAGLDVWSVPRALMQRSWDEIIEALSVRRTRELNG